MTIKKASRASTVSSYRFAGVSLGGGKTDKTAIAIVEYFPKQRRLFLRTLRDRIRGEGDISADLALHVALTEEESLHTIAFDVPLQMPKCIRCELKCPGYERCKLPEMKWLREQHAKRGQDKRPNKMFTPYTERCAEVFIANNLEEPFYPSHALGANAAPLVARAHFVQRRLKENLIETFPKLSLWRMGLELKVPKSHLRFHRHSIEGDESRLYFLRQIVDQQIAFIYQQDMRIMVENNQAFEAFLSALTAFLKFRNQTEKPPKGYPTREAWIEFPTTDIQWFEPETADEVAKTSGRRASAKTK